MSLGGLRVSRAEIRMKKKEHSFDICNVCCVPQSATKEGQIPEQLGQYFFYFFRIHWLNMINLSVYKVQGDFFF